MLEKLEKIIPRSWKLRIKERVNFWVKLNANKILGWLYWPDEDPQHIFGKRAKVRVYQSVRNQSSSKKNGCLPVPPKELRMNYAVESDDAFVQDGQRSFKLIESICERYYLLKEGDKVLDWGCASGRVLRHFYEKYEGVEIWGADTAEAYIRWNKENLSPPFHFLTSTDYPHLPFRDGTFSLIYAFSVFTHLQHLQDMWLMEMKRILKLNGIAIFTIHNEHTLEWFKKQENPPTWMPKNLIQSGLLTNDITTIDYETQHFSSIYTFFSSEWIKKEWGKYFQILEIIPMTESKQSAVVLKNIG